MRRSVAVAIGIMLAGSFASETLAQAAGAPGGQKTLASTINVYVFPTTGQDAKQQSIDEAECYNWAVQNTGNDPFQLGKQSAEQQARAEDAKKDAQKAGKGAAAAGAVKGAAVGALIGEIASDDAGEGAAWGATAGLISGKRRARAARRQAEERVEQRSEQEQRFTAEQLQNFKKAFSVCLEAKKYLVKH